MTEEPTTDGGLPVVRPLAAAAPRTPPDRVVTGPGWRISVLADGLFRLEWSPDGGFEDRTSTFAVDRRSDGTRFSVEREGHGVVVTTARARLRYDGRVPSPQGLEVELRGGASAGDRWRYGDEGRNLAGTARTLDGADGAVPLGDGVLDPRGVAVVDDSASFLFDAEGWIATRAPGRQDLYLFAHGRDHEAAVRAFYQVSGHPPVLPRWALGNWWSRYFPYTAQGYLDLLDRFDAEGVPLSVAVLDMDWHRVGSVPERFGNGWTGYSWEPERFPDPPGFLAALHARGLRTTLNLHPADGVKAFEDAYPEMARARGIDPATEEPVDFRPTDPGFLRAYFEHLHHPLERQGVDFWWVDWQQGSVSDVAGVDPLWLLNHYHYLDSARHGGRGMVFSRYAGPGSHRYAVGFSGDAVVSWRSLAFQPVFTATAANVGYAWWSHDIGGHLDGVRDDELATRWVQLGVFSPVLRLHSADNPFIRKEPWAFPAEPRAAMGEALRLRHRLVPYLHTMNHRAAAGVPLVRPMYHVDPLRPEAHEVPHQSWFGSEVVVAPVTTPRDAVSGLAATPVWLPPGTWTDLFTGATHAGDRHLLAHRPLDAVPAFVRAGGIVPLVAGDDLDATRNPTQLEVLVAPAAAGSFALVEDREDGDGARVARTGLRWDPQRAEFTVEAVTGDTAAVPAHRTWTVTLLGDVSGTAETTVGPVPVERSDGRVHVTVTAPTATTVTVRFPSGVTVGRDPLPDLRAVLDRAQTSHVHLRDAWAVLRRPDLGAAEVVGQLQATGLAPAVVAPLVELLSTLPPTPVAPDPGTGAGTRSARG